MSPTAPASLMHPRMARVHQHAPAAPGLLRSGDLVLDEERWTVHRAGTPIELSPTEFRLLACLMRHQGTVVSKAHLLRTVWGRGNSEQSQVVETYVSYLRRKLSRVGGTPLIHTRRGIGYMLRGPGGPGGPGDPDSTEPEPVRPAR